MRFDRGDIPGQFIATPTTAEYDQAQAKAIEMVRETKALFLVTLDPHGNLLTLSAAHRAGLRAPRGARRGPAAVGGRPGAGPRATRGARRPARCAVKVALTAHAVEKGKERCALTPSEIRAEVIAALEAGRRSKTKQRWMMSETATRHTRQGFRKASTRYVWPEDKSRAWVVVPKDGGWLVITCMSRNGGRA